MSRYDDIIDLPAPEPKKHRRMPMRDRAAQFAPFATLRGFDEAVDASAKYVERLYETNKQTDDNLANMRMDEGGKL